MLDTADSGYVEATIQYMLNRMHDNWDIPLVALPEKEITNKLFNIIYKV